ncbi:MAG: sulfatase-like hydrolase/transferase [Acidobacteriota bacterium]
MRTSSPRSGQQPPSFVFIMADDLGYGDIGAYRAEAGPSSGPRPETPHLDRLAADGLRFTQYYAMAPVCSPTRVSILSGLYPQRFGIREALAIGRPWSHRRVSHRGLPGPAAVLPTLLRNAGYDTVHVGKWHIGDSRVNDAFGPAAAGFDDHVTVIPEARRQGYCEESLAFADGTVRSTLDPDTPGHLTRWLVDLAIERLDARPPSGPPVFLNLWLRAPHVPWYPPSSCGKPILDYLGLVQEADTQVGRLLDRLWHRPNTLVLFASDNGPGGNAIGPYDSALGFAGGKGGAYEAGIRVPLLARWLDHQGDPVTPRGAITPYPAASFDLSPTMVEAAGGREPVTDGESFLRILRRPRRRRRATPLIWEVHRIPTAAEPPTGPEYDAAVRLGRWKLHLRSGVPDRLFDMDAESCEKPGRHDGCESAASDLLNDPAQRNRVRRLSRLYRSWRLDVSEVPLFQWTRVDGAVTFHPIHLPAGTAGSEMLFEGGLVRLGPHPLFDFHDGDATFCVDVDPDPTLFGAQAAIAGRAGAWRLRLMEDGRIRLVLRSQPQGQVPQVSTALTSDEPLAPGTFTRVAFVVSSGRAGNCPCDKGSDRDCTPGRESEFCQAVRLVVGNQKPVATREIPDVASVPGPLVLGGQRNTDGKLIFPFRGRVRQLRMFVNALSFEEVTSL